jgi:prepilin-type N-terminal cleavage/methylation domain-containing protein
MKNMRMKYTMIQGFTLIETLIAIMITGIIAAIAAPSFVAWINNENISKMSANVEGALKEAQSTAIRKNRTCNVWVTSTSASAVLNDISKTPDPSCLPSGAREISGHNSNYSIAGTGGSTGTMVSFSAVGTAIVTPTTSAFVIFQSSAPNSGRKNCVVISSGIGIIKTGKYTGMLPFSLSPTPTPAEVTAVSNQCSIS